MGRAGRAFLLDARAGGLALRREHSGRQVFLQQSLGNVGPGAPVGGGKKFQRNEYETKLVEGRKNGETVFFGGYVEFYNRCGRACGVNFRGGPRGTRVFILHVRGGSLGYDVRRGGGRGLRLRSWSFVISWAQFWRGSFRDVSCVVSWAIFVSFYSLDVSKCFRAKGRG